MLFPRLRKGIRFEVRKALHYLSIVWAVSICFHAPKRHIAIIMGLSVGLYAVDWLYGYFFKVYHAETLRFTRIGNAVEVVWEHPQGFESKGAGLHQPALDHARGVARLLARLAPLIAQSLMRVHGRGRRLDEGSSRGALQADRPPWLALWPLPVALFDGDQLRQQ